MVLAHHLIWTGYGWWLPNDPRGSGSREVRSDVLKDLGELHYERKRVQPAGRVVREFYKEAHARLRHPVLRFDTDQIVVVAAAFGTVLNKLGYTCYACAVMPDHVHLVVRKHRDSADEMLGKLQEGTRSEVVRELQIADDHPVWTRKGWKVFLDTPEDIRRTIRYVERNPIEARMPAQRWPFVVVYDGWPFHKQSRTR